jgi:hypothetical protein
VTSHVPHAHTPHQMRRMSNVGHWVGGALIAGAGTVVLRDALARDDADSRTASTVLAGAGALLGVALVGGSFEHGGPVQFFRADHQQREHLQMAALLTAGGLARRFGRTGRLLGSLATARIGQMFLTHEQHGTGEAAAEAKGKHERLGRTILGAAAASALGELFDLTALRAAGAALLVLSGLQLVAYREPPGAYELE